VKRELRGAQKKDHIPQVVYDIATIFGPRPMEAAERSRYPRLVPNIILAVMICALSGAVV
jgi:hypothetical protein